MKSGSPSEYQELDLSKLEHLKLFQDSANSIIEEIREFEKLIKANKKADKFNKKFAEQDVFEMLEDKNTLISDLVDKCKNVFLPKGDRLPLEVIDELQKLYDDLIVIRNFLLTEYEKSKSLESDVDESPAEDTIENKKVQVKSVVELSPAQNNYSDLDKNVMLCDLTAPELGKNALKQVHKMREVLLLARDRHPLLVNDTEKQILVDKLFRKLASVPPGGFAEESDMSEIISLIKNINVPHNVAIDVSESDDVDSDSSRAYEEEDVIDNYDLIARLKRKTMSITSSEDESQEQVVKIKIAKGQSLEKEDKSEVLKKMPIPKPKINHVPLVKQDKVSEVKDETQVIEKARVPVMKKTEVKPPLSKTIKKANRSKDGVSSFFNEEGILIIEEVFGSVGEFERIVKSEIVRIESFTVDKIGSWLGEDYYSPFDYIQNMAVSDVIKLSKNKNLRSELKDKNIKYETLLTWFDLLPEMKRLVGGNNKISFRELFTYWIVESEIEQINLQST